jgi:hypothetical protein
MLKFLEDPLFPSLHQLRIRHDLNRKGATHFADPGSRVDSARIAANPAILMGVMVSIQRPPQIMATAYHRAE